MLYEILATGDFRGTLGLKHKGEIVEITDTPLIEQLLVQGLIKLSKEEVKKPMEFYTKEEGKIDGNKN